MMQAENITKLLNRLGLKAERPYNRACIELRCKCCDAIISELAGSDLSIAAQEPGGTLELIKTRLTDVTRGTQSYPQPVFLVN